MRRGVTVLTSMMIGVSAGLIAAGADADELRSSCEGGYQVSAQESQGGAEQRFDLARRGADGLGEKQFAAASSAADGLRQQFIQVDEDSDGRISRDEWLRWFGPALADKAADGQQSTPD
jgi:hypothetical protein